MNEAGILDFLAMGGYALYVWGSFGVTLLALGWESSRVRAHRRSVCGALALRQWDEEFRT